MDIMRKQLNGMKPEDAVENILNTFAKTKSNEEFIQIVRITEIYIKLLQFKKIYAIMQ